MKAKSSHANNVNTMLPLKQALIFTLNQSMKVKNSLAHNVDPESAGHCTVPSLRMNTLKYCPNTDPLNYSLWLWPCSMLGQN